MQFLTLMVHFSLVAWKAEGRMHKDIQSILHAEDEIKQRVEQIGAALARAYAPAADAGETVLLLCVLRGAAIFAADLARAIDLPLEMDYVAVSSYGSQAQSSGTVALLKDASDPIEGKHVILVEDILDTGLTLHCLMDLLGQRNPASLAAVALLRKELPNQQAVECAHIGFECPDEFVVGYGLDYAQRYRNLPYIGILKPEVYA